MAFQNLKVTCICEEGACSRTSKGDTFYIRNARLELPPGGSVSLFALGSLRQPLSGAIIRHQEGEGILDVLEEWQCPDPLAKLVFKIEPENSL